MFKLTDYPVSDVEPWNTGFEQRLKDVLLSKRNGRRNIVYIYERADTSTFRYRAYNMCQALRFADHWTGNYFFENEIPFLDELLTKIDVVVFVRVRWSLIIDRFIHSVKKNHIPVLFDIDDLIYRIQSLPLIMNTLNVDCAQPREYEYLFTYVSRLYLTGTLCDGTIGTNEFLSARLEEDFQKPNVIVNNFLNHEQIDMSNRLFHEKSGLKSSRPFVIGYFSGTATHVNDFKKVAIELRDLMDTYPDMLLKVVGFMEFPNYLDEHKVSRRIIHEELVDFITLQKRIGEVDVNIVPLVDNEFTNCKSELKYFEAGIVGTITCATPTHVFNKYIQHGVNGFLCCEGTWYSAIESIYKGMQNEAIAMAARDHCIKTYSPEKQAQDLESVLDRISEIIR